MAQYTGTTASGLVYTASSTNVGVPPLLGTVVYDVTIAGSDGTTIKTLSGLTAGIQIIGLSVAPTGNVVTGSDSITTLLGLVGATYVTMPGSTGGINIVANAVSGNTYYIGGNTDINIAVNALSGNTLNIYGGTATFSGSLVAGLLSGSTINIGYGGTYSGSVGLINILSGSTVNFQDGGGTLILNADNQVLNLLATTGVQGVTFNNYDPSVDTIELQNTVQPIGSYQISTSGSGKTITLYGTNGTDVVASYAVNTASGVTLPDGVYTSIGSQDQSVNPLEITYSNGNTYIGACFLAGSMIRTPRGERAVESLTVGETVLVFENGQPVERPIVWTGKALAHVRAGLPDDEAGYPVRVMKNAISSGVPDRDLLVTPEHCLYFEGHFIPARMLVNGRTILFDRSVTTYTYYHIETAQHSVITANNVQTESYLDTGNRGSFRPYGTVSRISVAQARNWAEDAAAPLMVERHGVEPVFRELLARAEAMGVPEAAPAPTLTTESGLHLVTEDGRLLRCMRTVRGQALFMVPGSVQAVRLLSRTSRPCDVHGPFVDDRRSLGVCVGEAAFQLGGTVVPVTVHKTEASLTGWAELEGGAGRWTMGNALLPLPARAPESFGILSLQILAGGPYVEQETEEASRVSGI
ncbi:Hint domain-containing protein [Acetobacter persici]|uniref:Hint domain-containing protein n=1 Tax=Acetobacter persici TaxID=1076596 RepID=UPI0020CF31F5|nr:Hint domain-containing protein [Acetobacter persici]MCP9318821.1 Hint domain-containing protein [Acetobacter persici]